MEGRSFFPNTSHKKVELSVLRQPLKIFEKEDESSV